MKPSFSIGARNGLLEQKHLDALGPAVWLYLWCLDKQPKNTDKVLSGRPITYQMFAANFPDVPRRTYFDWLRRLQDAGYISLTRTPRGSVITISKPKKWAKSDVQVSALKPNSDVQKTAPEVKEPVRKSAPTSAKNCTSNIRETINNTLTTEPLHKQRAKNQTSAKDLLDVLNEVCERSFRAVPKSAHATAKSFTADEVRTALTKLVKDEWHQERIGGLNAEYLLRATTIDKFLTAKQTKKKAPWV